ncbi:unnamed protein product [Angiostrongylus costaricensis]|uniref:Endo/exonuclease/phosphatase domain-containing protein n=1 Tax=Angiostrongylus costaricensis TaxID=334426 RepID=A0A0R3PH69_ANGCS|nr:unnamed protein product [Angiostrongylus costaricensis]
MTHAEIDHILTKRRWCLLDISVIPSFSTDSDHRLCAKIRFSRKLEKNSLHRSRGKSLVVYDKNIVSEVLSKRDWQIKEYLTEDYELLVEGLKAVSNSPQFLKQENRIASPSLLRSCWKTEGI